MSGQDAEEPGAVVDADVRGRVVIVTGAPGASAAGWPCTSAGGAPDWS